MVNLQLKLCDLNGYIDYKIKTNNKKFSKLLFDDHSFGNLYLVKYSLSLSSFRFFFIENKKKHISFASISFGNQKKRSVELNRFILVDSLWKCDIFEILTEHSDYRCQSVNEKQKKKTTTTNTSLWTKKSRWC